jgi:hypothetical protein
MSELAHEEKQPMLAALVPAASGKEPVPPTPPV